MHDWWVCVRVCACACMCTCACMVGVWVCMHAYLLTQYLSTCLFLFFLNQSMCNTIIPTDFSLESHICRQLHNQIFLSSQLYFLSTSVSFLFCSFFSHRVVSVQLCYSCNLIVSLISITGKTVFLHTADTFCPCPP